MGQETTQNQARLPMVCMKSQHGVMRGAAYEIGPL